jgi:hypothetical protein
MRTRSPLPLKIYWASVDNLDIRFNEAGEARPLWRDVVGHLQS